MRRAIFRGAADADLDAHLLRWIGHDRVALLDGGLQAWLAAGGALTREVPRHEPGELIARPVDTRWITTEALAADLTTGRLTLIDARAPERFRGDQEPIDPVAGHIPGAINLPLTDNLGADGRFHCAERLRERFTRAIGQTPASSVVHSCGSGVNACHNLFMKRGPVQDQDRHRLDSECLRLFQARTIVAEMDDLDLIPRRVDGTGEMLLGRDAHGATGCKWSISVLQAIGAGIARPGALEHHIDGISTKVLSERLRKLTHSELLSKQVFAESPPRTEYRLTEKGRKLVSIIDQIRTLDEEPGETDQGDLPGRQTSILRLQAVLTTDDPGVSRDEDTATTNHRSPLRWLGTGEREPAQRASDGRAVHAEMLGAPSPRAASRIDRRWRQLKPKRADHRT
ncbi:MAG: winged helix-turn-helix transcriptional regulator [Thiocapsa sp.]|uniref:winged helix-turn-helix transcriptional regulator n=1 Tax=Thiocapsa sp. TaxID=2024551 RepID=UPI001BCCAD14|nr:winged helix-turn-helix transcriptional regulator [Thiocapsa sp.]QVL51083.1 MAG: winged helix-turn-helix transcriptional regulator [Thiocapsa sp.]